MPRDLPHGAFNTNDTALRHADDRIGFRFVPEDDLTLHRFGSLFRASGTTQVGGSTAGYGWGGGGTYRWRLVAMDPATGLPDFTRELAREDVTFQRMWERRTGYPGTTVSSGWYWGEFGGVPLAAGVPVWVVLQNIHPDPAANWISQNGPNGPLGGAGGDMGYQGVNYPFEEPVTPRSFFGLERREVAAWSTTGDVGPWRFGRLGGLLGQTRPPKPGSSSTGYYEKSVIPMWGWTTAPGNVKFRRTCTEQAYNAGATIAGGSIEVTARRAGVATHAHAFLGSSGSPGTVTVLNEATGMSATADLNTGFSTFPGGREKVLSAPVPYAVGDRLRISASGTVRRHEVDSTQRPFFEFLYLNALGGEATIQAGCTPWPGFLSEVTAPPPPPPPPPPDPDPCAAEVAQIAALTAERDAALALVAVTASQRDVAVAERDAALARIAAARAALG